MEAHTRSQQLNQSLTQPIKHPRISVQKRVVDGILVLDKPEGVSSNGALQMSKRLFQAKKAGHSGSLDPIATGLLLFCFGEATKFARFLLESDKHYHVKAQLGVTTDSGDRAGEVLQSLPVPHFDTASLLTLIQGFKGEISQVPPMYSALKHQGTPLYRLARQGISVEREARKVQIYEITLVDYQPPFLELDIKVSKGTYIRSLVESIGAALGCGAHVVDLRRLAAGPFRADQMISFSSLEAIFESKGLLGLDACLLPIEMALLGYPSVTLSSQNARFLYQGKSIRIPYPPKPGLVKLSLETNRFLGVGEVLENGEIRPFRLVSIDERYPFAVK